MNTHICKSCETTFTPTQKKTAYQKSVMIITVIILAFVAWSGASAQNAAMVIVALALIGVRIWMYQRATKAACPACKSNDCIGIDTPAGKRIAKK